jgi:two-component system response regulator AtoC
MVGELHLKGGMGALSGLPNCAPRCDSLGSIPDDMNHSPSAPERIADTDFVFGHGRALESLNATVTEIARTDIPVWILGESGTGKEVYARLLHRLSGSSDTPLRKLSCAVLGPAELLREVRQGPSKDDRAHFTSTLFLDGIDELDLACQRILLSVLPDSQRPGGYCGKFGRLISSSSRNLEESVETGEFRKELYFRINGVCIRLLPLRDRREDIPALVDFFLERHCHLLKKAIPALDNEAMELFLSYSWPGNIRELENMIKKMVALGEATTTADELRTIIHRAPKAGGSAGVVSLKTMTRAALRQTERELILKALERTRWNRKRAAQELQISYKSLLSKIKQIGLEKVDSNEL